MWPYNNERWLNYQKRFFDIFNIIGILWQQTFIFPGYLYKTNHEIIINYTLLRTKYLKYIFQVRFKNSSYNIDDSW